MPKVWREEVIPVPYGSICCKVWGEEKCNNDRCFNILAIHGWQDNAGTFDNLIPLLDFNATVVAVDMPGHGLSSHLPTGVVYTDFNYIIDIRRIVEHFGWNKYSFVGHSMGGMIALYFASFYPDEVEFVVCLDVLKPLTNEAANIAETIKTTLNTFLNIEKKIIAPKTPTYTFDEAIRRLIEAHSVFGIISEESAKILLKRGAKQIGEDSYVFRRDLRLRSLMFTRQTDEAMTGFLSRLKCEILIIMANKGVKHDKEEVKRKFIEVYEKYAKRFKFVEIDGEHHIHLNNAGAVVRFINDFVSKCGFKNGNIHNGYC